ncbi:hypothetical protein [Geminocystis sp.]|uniref:hypothetical protein n=1 Tax=Geminocystis sp. TaxID=2664100 RepID=UPI00359376F0
MIINKTKFVFKNFSSILTWSYNKRRLTLKITNVSPEIIDKVLNYAIHDVCTGINSNKNPLDIDSFGVMDRVQEANSHFRLLMSKELCQYRTTITSNNPPSDPLDGDISAYEDAIYE